MAHFEFTHINIEPIVLRKKIEDFREEGAFTLRVSSGRELRVRGQLGAVELWVGW